VDLSGEDFSRYSNIIESVMVYENVFVSLL